MTLFRFTVIDDSGGIIFNGQRITNSVFYYRLPREWELAP